MKRDEPFAGVEIEHLEQLHVVHGHLAGSLNPENVDARLAKDRFIL
jgi:hypothetical protein